MAERRVKGVSDVRRLQTNRSVHFFIDLRQKDLETLVPKIKDATVLVVRGIHAGRRARMMEVRARSGVWDALILNPHSLPASLARQPAIPGGGAAGWGG